MVRYNGGPIESLTCFIKWHYLQGPWTTPYRDFKVGPLFDAEYLRNGSRYDHSYYGM